MINKIQGIKKNERFKSNTKNKNFFSFNQLIEFQRSGIIYIYIYTHTHALRQ